MKRILSILLISVLVLTTSVVFADNSYASAMPANWQFTGAHCTSNKVAASTIDYIQARYPNNTQYKGSGECWGWAEKISTMLASKRSTKYYKGLPFTEENLLKKCKGAKAGTHIRISNNKEFSGYSGHSIVILKLTKDEVCWTEANAGGYNNIRYGCADPAFLTEYYGGYLNAVIKPTAYKGQPEPLLTIKRSDQGKATLYWAKSSNTSKYKVYRSASKTGKYKLIKTTTAGNYTDAKAPLGKKYYYKVKGVKKSGGTVESDKKSFTNKLAAPVFDSFSNENSGGHIQVSWKPIKKADKYKVYRANTTNGEHKFQYIGWTKKTTFTDKKANKLGNYYAYKVKAVYSKNTNANSVFSDEFGYYNCRLAAPTLSYVYDEASNVLNFSWDKPANAGGYELHYTTLSDGLSYYCGFKEEQTYTFDLNYMTPGTVLQFYVVAHKDKNDYTWHQSYKSMPSNVIEFTVPDNPNASQNPYYGYEYWF